MTKKMRTIAFQQYAKKYGYSTSTVRTTTILRELAIKEYKTKKGIK